MKWYSAEDTCQADAASRKAVPGRLAALHDCHVAWRRIQRVGRPSCFQGVLSRLALSVQRKAFVIVVSMLMSGSAHGGRISGAGG